MTENSNNNRKSPQNRTKQITLAAVLAAISGVMIIITNFTPLTFILLMVAAFCYYLAFERCGIILGLCCIGVSILMSFFTSPLSAAFFLTILAAAPYSFIAFILKKMRYTHLKEAAIRVTTVTAFAILLFTAIYFLTQSVLNLDLSSITAKIGWWAFAILFTIAFIGFDLIFTQCAIRAQKILK